MACASGVHAGVGVSVVGAEDLPSGHELKRQAASGLSARGGRACGGRRRQRHHHAQGVGRGGRCGRGKVAAREAP